MPSEIYQYITWYTVWHKIPGMPICFFESVSFLGFRLPETVIKFYKFHDVWPDPCEIFELQQFSGY